LNKAIASLQGWGLALYARLLHATCPSTFDGWEHLQVALDSQRPVIASSWHGQAHLFYGAFASRVDLSQCLMPIAGDDREDVLYYFGKYLKTYTLPISGEDKSMGTAQSLRALIQAIKQGTITYMSPDGPDGPARVAKPGIALLARQAEALIVPLSGAARYARHINRWDQYTLPLPFDRIYVSIRPPIEINRGAKRQAILEQVSEEMNRADARAREMAQGSNLV
jgi:lysophospholipid acyltransferase (LPLAT)-like uncharacterized protein